MRGDGVLLIRYRAVLLLAEKIPKPEAGFSSDSPSVKVLLCE